MHRFSVPSQVVIYNFLQFGKTGETESEMMSHSAFFNICKSKTGKIFEDRSVLEALGLLETYFYETKDGEQPLYLPDERVLDPYAFPKTPICHIFCEPKLATKLTRKSWLIC